MQPLTLQPDRAKVLVCWLARSAPLAISSAAQTYGWFTCSQLLIQACGLVFVSAGQYISARPYRNPATDEYD
jgi:hypothetical protein